VGLKEWFTMVFADSFPVRAFCVRNMLLVQRF